MSVIGIDFGTTHSSMARPSQPGERAYLVRDAEGNEKTPSVVYFGDAETLVGTEAINVLVEARGDDLVHARVIQSVKRRLINPPRIALPGGRAVRPVEVAAEILAKLRRDAEAIDPSEQLARAVITYPAVFDAAQASAIVEAATMAGFDEVELVEEPVAAAIAFQHEGGQVGQGVLVFDYGGGTFDAAFVVREQGEDGFYLALEPDGDAECGGDDLDQTLYDYFDAQARGQLGRPISLRDNTVDIDFLRTCRRRKEILSTSRQATFSTMLDGGVRFTSSIDRAAFEELIASQVDRTVRITERTAQRAREAGYPVDTVLLVGGSSQAPLVQQRITQTLGLQPLSWGHRDVAVAIGAAYHAQAVWGRSSRRQSAQDSRQRYQRSVELVWSDGRLEPAEAHRLEGFRRELGLNSEDAAQIERRVIGRTKEELVAPGPAQPVPPRVVEDGGVTEPSARTSRDFATAVGNQIRRAEAHRHSRRPEEAIAAFNRALEIDPNSEDALSGRAEVYFSLHRLDEARADLNKALDRSPDFYRALIARARVNAEQFRLSESLEDARRAIELDPEVSQGFTAQGWTFSLSGAAEGALACFERALGLDPMSVDALVGRALAKVSLGRNDQAKLDFDQALELDPNYVPAHVGQALAHMQDEDYLLATVVADKALEFDPRAPSALSTRGLLDMRLGSLSEATARFDTALAVNPDWVPAMAGRAEVALQEGRPADALAELDRGLELVPRSADLCTLRGMSHRALEDNVAALEDYDRAMSQPEGLSVVTAAELHVMRGQVRAALQRNRDAMDDFGKAIELDPKLAVAYLERGWLHTAAEDFEEGLADADKAVALDPTNLDSRAVRAAALGAFLHFTLGPGSTEPRRPSRRTGNFYNRSAAGNRKNLNQRLLRQAKLENGWAQGQQQALVDALNDTEAVVWLCRCARTVDMIRQVALVVTSERLVWCRRTLFGSRPELGQVSYARIATVNDAPDGFLITGVAGESVDIGFKSIFTGVDLSGLKLSLDGTDVRELVRILVMLSESAST